MPRKKRPFPSLPPSDRDATLILTEYEITTEPIREKWYRKLPGHIKDAIERLHNLAQENPRQAIKELPGWIEKYPDIPMLYNYLSVAYSSVHAHQRAEEVIAENYRRNPDYLFARLNYAEICLGNGDYRKVAEILDHKFDLKLLYPNRKRFHISEFLGFMNVTGRYYAAVGEDEAAQQAYQAMHAIAPEDPTTRHLRSELHPGPLKKAARALLKRMMSSNS